MPEPNYNGLKWIFLGLIAATFLCFVMGGVTLRRQIARLGRKPQAPLEVWRPSPFAKAPVSTPKDYPQARPPEPANPPERQVVGWQHPPVELLGRWQGTGATTTGFFNITMEITPDTRNPAQLLAYVRTMVISLAGPTPLGKPQPSVTELIEQRFPRQFSMVGTPSDNGGALFRVAQAIGAQGTCPITEIRISGWGSDGIAAEWKGTNCGGGSAILVKPR